MSSLCTSQWGITPAMLHIKTCGDSGERERWEMGSLLLLSQPTKLYLLYILKSVFTHSIRPGARAWSSMTSSWYINGTPFPPTPGIYYIFVLHTYQYIITRPQVLGFGFFCKCKIEAFKPISYLRYDTLLFYFINFFLLTVVLTSTWVDFCHKGFLNI